ELLNMKDPPLRALYVSANNPAVTCPEVHKVIKGLSREDLFTVVHDPFLSDTARYADIVLPAATYLESEDVVRSYGTYYAEFVRLLFEGATGTAAGVDPSTLRTAGPIKLAPPPEQRFTTPSGRLEFYS